MRVRKAIYLAVVLLSLAFNSFAQNLYEVKSLDFNTREFDEFAPLVYGNGLVVNTNRTQFLYKTAVDLNEQNINDFYFIPKLADGSWGNAEFFSKELNSRFHEGKATFTRDGNTIYFTRFENDSSGNIYKAIKSGGEWNNQMLISLNSKKYRIKDPSISGDGKKLFFASMAPGGFGGYDIYVSTFEKGDWSTPRNLGSLVNTRGDEVSPFIQANGRLYFSSNKLPGLGRFDIFYTREVDNKWILPVHLSEPVNSSRDDLYYYSNEGDSIGYFSSNRNRSFDIFSLKYKWPHFEGCKPLQKNEYTYVFFEKGSVDTDTTAWLFEWDFGDGTKSRGKKAEAEHTFAETGQYLVQLNVIDTLTGEIMLNEDTYPFTVANIEQPYISSADTLHIGVKANFNAKQTNLPSFNKIAAYYWDFGDGEHATGLESEHSFYQKGKFTVRLCVVSAQDETGKVKSACVSKDIFVIEPL